MEEMSVPDPKGSTSFISGNQRDYNLRSYQTRALIRKSAALKKRQYCSNCCHLCIPITCIVLVGLIGIIMADFGSSLDPNKRIITPDKSDLQPSDGDNYYECLAFLWFTNPDNSSIGTLDPDGNGTGMLSHVRQSACRWETIKVPFFREMESSSQINEQLYELQKKLRNNPNRNMSVLPDGAILFEEFQTSSSIEMKYVLQIPDSRQDNYQYLRNLQRSNMFWSDTTPKLIHILSDATVKFLSNVTLQAHAYLQGWPYMVDFSSITRTVISSISAILYPLALSFLLPSFIYVIVLEKQEKLKELMKMMGMNIYRYWLITYLFDLLLFGIVAAVFVLLGLAFQLELFFNPVVLLLLLFSWGHTLIAMSFFVSSFISRNRTITAVLLYLAVFITAVVGGVLNIVYGEENWRWEFCIYPPFAFYHGLYRLGNHCADGYCMSITQLTPDSPEAYVILILWGHTILFGVIALYLDQVLPREFGIPKHPLFPLHALQSFIKKRKMNGYQQVVNDISFQQSGFLDDEWKEDSDVQREREMIERGEVPSSTPIVIQNLSKKYPGANKVALNQLYLTINEGELFGLLGPNGAGKSTTISILTGLFPPSSGTARVGGFDVIEEMNKVHLVIGVCPQFDVQWPTLTVKEHLLFYARLKGISPKDEMGQVIELATKVGLETYLDRKSKELSGGMQRRLSVAMALIGNPRIVFLDEPTSGLDPTSRRHLWGVFDSYREGRSIVLTTHSMEEADTLCSSIGIIAKGRLQCLGSPSHLKNKFGSGYTLQLTTKSEDTEDLEKFIRDLVPDADLVNHVGNSRIYKLHKGSFKVSQLLKDVEENKKVLGIEDWGLSQTSLEEVFLSICREEEAEQQV